MRARPDFPRYVTDGRLHQNLRAGAAYYVLGVGNESYRIVNHNGEPILYPKELFEVVDPTVPSGWKFDEYDDGEYVLHPRFAGPGFYEQWHNSDGDLPGMRAARTHVRDELVRLADESAGDDRHLLLETLERLRP
ncbi:MAG: hypothetical protein KF773_22955 [Deltaproteobacteria bacterium]|nr:hypothetical protein [Deltaproteobacteria bacterium]